MRKIKKLKKKRKKRKNYVFDARGEAPIWRFANSHQEVDSIFPEKKMRKEVGGHIPRRTRSGSAARPGSQRRLDTLAPRCVSPSRLNPRLNSTGLVQSNKAIIPTKNPKRNIATRQPATRSSFQSGERFYLDAFF